MKRHGDVLVFAENNDGKVHPVSYELLGKGRELADSLGVDLNAVLLGWRMENEALELIYRGADNVFLYDHPILEEFDVIRYTRNIVKMVRETKPDIFLVGATRIGRTLAPRIAAALRTGLTADCVDLKLDEEGNLVQVRPAFSGNIMAQIVTKTRPQMATVRYKVMKMPERDAGWISKDHQVGFSGNTVKPRIYIACGISGSPQHLFGMRDSDIIIAVNKDPTAPIFNVSDYGVVGDLYEFIPLLIREVKRLIGEGQE